MMPAIHYTLSSLMNTDVKIAEIEHLVCKAYIRKVAIFRLDNCHIAASPIVFFILEDDLVYHGADVPLTEVHHVHVLLKHPPNENLVHCLVELLKLHPCAQNYRSTTTFPTADRSIHLALPAKTERTAILNANFFVEVE
jgi:hypothetical protein